MSSSSCCKSSTAGSVKKIVDRAITRKTFYRRPLPDKCIAFGETKGKELFKEAIRQAYMEIYFPLAEQFITQAEPAYCGLSTLAMCLNALHLDPDRLWKGPWRWFSEELFDCCTPLHVAKENGISFTEFECLAKCNGAKVESQRATEKLTIEAFREVVKSSCSSTETILVLNYSRKTLGQTGDGHFSPIGGYHKDSDMVLILDVARFKYPPHWIPLQVAFEAMYRLDPSNNLTRGYFILTRSPRPMIPGLLRLKVDGCMCEYSNKVRQTYLHMIPNSLQEKQHDSVDLVLQAVTQVMMERQVPRFESLLPRDITCIDHASILFRLLRELSDTALFQKVSRWDSDRLLPVEYFCTSQDQVAPEFGQFLSLLTCMVLFTLPKDVLSGLKPTLRQVVSDLLDLPESSEHMLSLAVQTTQKQLTTIIRLSKPATECSERDKCCGESVT